MKKELVIVIIVIIAIIVASIKTQSYTVQCVDNISNELNQVKEELINSQETKNTKNKTDEIANTWEKMYENLAYYLEHDELEKVNEAITAMRSNIQAEEMSGSIEQLDRCIFILEHIKEKEAFNLKNIF